MPAPVVDHTFFLCLLISVLPIVSFGVIMIFTRENPKLSLGISLTASTVPLILAWYLFVRYWGLTQPVVYNLKWLYSEIVKIPFGFLLDPTSLLMLVIVATISWLVQIYSIGYMAGDPGFGRYYAFLSLFAFSMLTLSISSGLLQLYICWELVGLASYLLIGFWYEKFSASEAGKKAFVVTRFGDVGFFMGLAFLTIYYGNLEIQQVNSAAVAHSMPAWLITTAALLIFLRRHGQERPVPHPCLAAGCHGRSDAGQRPPALGHHGGGGGLSHRPDLPLFQCFPPGDGRGSGHRHHNLAPLLHHRDGGLGYQAGVGLFHGQPVGFHDHGPGGGQLFRRLLSLNDPCRL